MAKPKHRRHGGSKGRRIEQVPAASLVPPAKPAEVTDEDVDPEIEPGVKAALEEAEAKVKELRKKLGLQKKALKGSKKLEKKREFAAATTDWAQKAAGKFATSVDRANEAVSSLKEYEEKLGLEPKDRKHDALVETLEPLVAAAESVPDSCIELVSKS